MGDRTDMDEFPYENGIEDAYRGHGSQQGRDTSWTDASELYVPDMRHSDVTTGFDGLGDLSILEHGDNHNMISDLSNMDDSWDRTTVDNQAQPTIAPLRYDPEQYPTNDTRFANLNSFQLSVSNNNPGMWETPDPWNPLPAAYGTAYNRPPFHESRDSSQRLSSGMPSQGGMSSRSNEQTWFSNDSSDVVQTGSADDTNTGRQSLTLSNLDQMFQAPVNSVPSGPNLRVGCGTPMPGLEHGNRCAQADDQRRSHNHLTVPDDTVSLLSVTPAYVPSNLYCTYAGCNHKFTGTHRRGTLHRHFRLKHMMGQGSAQQERQYPCPVEGCGKNYKRQDARLKHFRSKHPELHIAPPVSRKHESED